MSKLLIKMLVGAVVVALILIALKYTMGLPSGVQETKEIDSSKEELVVIIN